MPLASKRVTIGQGTTVVPLRAGHKVGAIYLELGGFRDWLVADAYGEIAGRLGAAPEEE